MKTSQFITILGVVLLIVVIRVVIYYNNKGTTSPTELTVLSTTNTFSVPSIGTENGKPYVQKMFEKVFSNEPLQDCDDPLWCNIEMPTISHFMFEPPSDTVKWRQAQIQASTGEHVLLKRIVKVFPNYQDFLDGDSSFRKYNLPIDIFIDKKRDLSPLKQALRGSRRLEAFDWEEKGKKVIPDNYDFAAVKRAPVVKLGYFAFATDGGSLHFEGPQVGEAGLSLREFLDQWKAVKDEIQTPFIALHSANENWGLLSTYFPNRTIDWGRCCDKESKDLYAFLDHPKTLMFMVGQHSNITHPKLITLPRGLPLPQYEVKKIIWDMQRMLINEHPKNQLVFTASSSWGPRPQVMECVRRKFSPTEFTGAQTGKIGRDDYYRRLGQARTGLALAGMGMDTFRMWESLTLGTVPVVERGFGLDKTLWRLPALLVDDFDEVTPELLRTAYVEALYRADDFEFERLTQSFWWSFIANVSVTMDTQTVLDKFPPYGEDVNFRRPAVPFDCWKTNSCGKGTKRIPKSSC